MKTCCLLFSNLKNKENIFFSLILILNLILTIYGNNWGLPDRWNVDESVATSLKMAAQKTILPPKNDTHPTFYYFFLMLVLSPYIFYLKLSGFPIEQLRQTAAVSWIKFAEVFPEIATNLYFIARCASALLGALTIYLIFLIAARLYNKKVGLYSAGVLAITMGFVAENHFAKSSALVNLLVTVVILLCIKALHEKVFHKYFYLAAFLVGLSFSTKFNGAIGLLSLLTSYLLRKNKAIEEDVALRSMPFRMKLRFYFFSKALFFSLLLICLGIITGYPAIIINSTYFIKGVLYYKVYLPGASQITSVNLHIFTGLKNNFLRLISIFGPALCLFVIFGFLKALREIRKKKYQPELLLILIFVFTYFIIFSAFQRYPKMAVVKYIILIIPILSVFGGKAIYDFISIKWLSNRMKVAVLASVFFISVIYTLSLDVTFARKDTRYAVTRWVEENILSGSTISIFDEVDWLFSSKLLSRYNVIYFGNSSIQSRDKNLFQNLNDEKLREGYFAYLNEYGIRSDYAIVSINSFAKLSDYIIDPGLNVQGNKFMQRLINGELGYKLVKKFEDKMPFFWNPKNEYMSPTILVYKR